MIAGQVMIIYVGGVAFSVRRLNGVEWGVSIILSLLSIPVAIIVRLIPDQAFAKLMPSCMKRGKPAPVYVANDARFEWNQGIEGIREELQFLKMVRGGRLNQLKFARRNVKETMKENLSHLFLSASKSGNLEETAGGQGLPSPSPTRRRRSSVNSAFAASVIMPGVVAGGVGGWSPVEKPGVGDADTKPFG